MKDTDQNYAAFLKGLSAMSEYFSDVLSEGRQELYWEHLYPRISLEEWEYACYQAMDRETFHKVPLIEPLMEYVREYRTAQREAKLQRAEQGAAKLLPQWSPTPDERRAEGDP